MKRIDMQKILAQSGAAFELKQGQILKVIDPEGEQVSDMVCFSADDIKEWLSSGKTLDYCNTMLITKGHNLYSNRSRAFTEQEKVH